MNLVLRLLGVQVLARAAARLPGRAAWVATAVVLAVVDLLPLVAVVRGDVGMADVFLVYWLENVVVWLVGMVRVSTADGQDGARLTSRGDPIGHTQFFALHYGVFTLVHGIFTAFIVGILGLDGGVLPVLVLTGATAASQLWYLGAVWFGRGQQHLVSTATAMFAPYPRMLVLQVGIIVGFSVAVGGDHHDQQTAVGVLCGLKLAVDLAFHLRSWGRSRQPVEE